MGGEQLDAGLNNISVGARVVICGAISQYNALKPVGPASYLKVCTASDVLAYGVVRQFSSAGGCWWVWAWEVICWRRARDSSCSSMLRE